MNADQIAESRKWARELRSGMYEQCRSNIMVKRQDRFAYCCLGVAAVIQPHVKLTERVVDNKNEQYYLFNTLINTDTQWEITTVLDKETARIYGLVNGRAYYLPKEVSIHRLPHRSALFVEERDAGSYVNLAVLNDDAKLNFDEIADVIEVVCNAWEEHNAKS